MRIGAFLIGLVVVLVIGGSSVYITQSTQEHLTATVLRDGERVCSESNGTLSCKYLEFFDTETFENTDNLWVRKFNSSDVHGRIREGKICDLLVTGFRIPVLSTYRNILSANCY